MEEKIESLRTADNYIDNLKDGINKIVNYIENGQEEKGIGLIPFIADGVEWLLKVINLTKELHKENITTGDIDEKLANIVEGLENEDYILVSDLFNYEILPILEDMQSNIRKIVLN